MSGYDRAITVFSPDGHLFQVRKSPTNISYFGKASDEGGVLTIIIALNKVEYAQEAVKKGSTAVGVSGAHIDSVAD